MLSIELLNSFTAFDFVKIKTFDRESFQRDVALCLEQFIN